MHNADDILADRASIEATKEAMGRQMTVYPYGGHLGNLWYPVHEARILGYCRCRSPGVSMPTHIPSRHRGRGPAVGDDCWQGRPAMSWPRPSRRPGKIGSVETKPPGLLRDSPAAERN
jgi:hypothetical protein